MFHPTGPRCDSGRLAFFFSLQNGIIYGNYPDSNWGQRIERMLGREILSKLPLIVFFFCVGYIRTHV